MPYYWLAIFISVFVWSAINPHDYFTWVLEVLPAVIGALVVAVSFKRFKLTALLFLSHWHNLQLQRQKILYK